MNMRLIIGSSIIVGGLITACGNANFTGGSRRSDDTPAQNPAPENSPQPTDPSQNKQDDVPGTSTPSTQNNPTPTTPNGPGIPGAPGYPTVPGTPNTPGSVPPCTNQPCQPSQVPQYGPNTEILQTPNSIIFGRDRLFHIGNGQYQNTSCKLEVTVLPLSGSVYFFQFEVMNDNTQVQINISHACGIDYGSSVLQLAKNGQQLAANNLQVGAKSAQVPASTLNKGVYTIYVYAGKGDGKAGATWDIDDFVLGRVQINANQAVKAGNFGTYK
jgi:hypothetical protein